MASLPVRAQTTPWPSWYVPPEPEFDLRRIIHGVANSLRIAPDEMTGRGRLREYVHGRAVVAQILRERGWSTTMIGRALDNRDHTTILNLLNKMDVYFRYPGVRQVYLKHRCPKSGRLC